MCHVCSTPTQYFVGPSLKSLPRDRIGLPWLRLFVRPLSFQQHAVLASQIKPRPLPSNHATIRQFRKWASDIKAFPAFQLPKKFNVSWQSRFHWHRATFNNLTLVLILNERNSTYNLRHPHIKDLFQYYPFNYSWLPKCLFVWISQIKIFV